MNIKEIERRARFLVEYSGDEMAKVVVAMLPVLTAADAHCDVVWTGGAGTETARATFLALLFEVNKLLRDECPLAASPTDDKP